MRLHIEVEPCSPAPDPRLMCSGSSGLLSKVRYTGSRGRGSVRGCPHEILGSPDPGEKCENEAGSRSGFWSERSKNIRRRRNWIRTWTRTQNQIHNFAFNTTVSTYCGTVAKEFFLLSVVKYFNTSIQYICMKVLLQLSSATLRMQKNIFFSYNLTAGTVSSVLII